MPIDASRPFIPIGIAVLTISDTRSFDDDRSGDILGAGVTAAGHRLAARAIVKDEINAIIAKLRSWIGAPDIDVVITTGGTGVTGRDVTPEALADLGGKDIPGFGELFRWISFQSIGTSTIQSRACARLVDRTFIFALPGSTGAVTDAWEKILRDQLDSRHRPCNFVELIPRLSER